MDTSHYSYTGVYVPALIMQMVLINFGINKACGNKIVLINCQDSGLLSSHHYAHMYTHTPISKEGESFKK